MPLPQVARFPNSTPTTTAAFAAVAVGWSSSSLAANLSRLGPQFGLAGVIWHLDYLSGSPEMLCFWVFSAEGLALAVLLIAYQEPLKPVNVELIPTMALSTIEPS